MSQPKVTTISVPENHLAPLLGHSVANKFFALGGVIDAFLLSAQATPAYVAGIPVPKFKPAWENVPVRMNKRNAPRIRAWRKRAAEIAPRGSLGALATAALYWMFLDPQFQRRGHAA